MAPKPLMIPAANNTAKFVSTDTAWILAARTLTTEAGSAYWSL